MQGRTERLPVSQFRLSDIRAITKQRVYIVVDQRPDAQPLVFPTLVARGRQCCRDERCRPLVNWEFQPSLLRWWVRGAVVQST